MQTEGKKLKAAREADLKRRDKLKLQELRERIKRSEATRRHAYQQIAHYCRLGRQNVSARVRRLRQEAREAINRRAATLRKAQAEQCAADQAAARVELDQEVARVRAELEQDQRSFKHHYGRKSSRSSAAERRAESDDEVEHNLPRELVTVFRKVKRAIKGTPRKSRTEAFLQWVEENPDDVHAMLYAAAERDVARLIAEHERVSKRLRKGRKAYDDPEELAHALAGVPF